MGGRTINREEIRRILQEKIARYMSVQQSVRAYQLVYEMQRNQLEELLITKQALQSLQKNPPEKFDGFSSLGSGVFIHISGTIKKEVLVNIGANIGVSMSINDALEVLEERETKMRTNLENTAKTLRELINLMVNLEREIAALQQYLSGSSQES